MADDKIKYSDLVQPDDSIKELISQLTTLNTTFGTALDTIKQSAQGLAKAMASASGATKKGRADIDEAAMAATRLERAQQELAFALSETGKQVAWLKAQTSDANKSTVEQQRYARQAASSYERINADLKESVKLYKSLTKEQREHAGMGQQLLADIIGYKKQLKELDNQMRMHIQVLSETERAEQKLAFLQSEEGQKLLDLKAKISAVTNARKQKKEQVSALAAAEQKLQFALSNENIRLNTLTLQTQRANKEAKLKAILAKEKAGTYNYLAAQYELCKIKLNGLTKEERENTAAGRRLVEETKGLYYQMRELQEATGNFSLGVGDYKQAWRGLGFSVSQVVRELPAAAISMNTFFLAISNNVPMVIDEIQKLRAQNQAFIAQGKPTVNITKAIVRSLFSWNTALVLVLTAFTMFGDKITKWIDDLISGRDSVLSVTEAMETLNEELADNASTYGREISILRRLSDEWKRLGDNLKEQQQWIKDNQSEFNKLDISINDVNTASTVFVDSTGAFIDALKARAKAQAALNILSEKTGELLKLENDAEVEKTKEYSFFENTANYFKAFIAGFSGPDSDLSFSTRLATQRQRNIKELEADKTELQETVDSYFKVYQFYIDKTVEIYEKLGLQERHKKDKGRTPRDAEDTLESLSLAATKAYQKSLTELERDEIKKRRQEAKEAEIVEIADLERKFKKIQRILDGQDERYKALTEEQTEIALKAQEEIWQAIINKREATKVTLSLLDYAQEQHDAEKLLETLGLQMKVAKEGSEEELALRLKILEAEEKIALARNAQLPPSEQQNPLTISAGFKRQKTNLITESGLATFDQYQALQEANFNAVKHNETEITKFKLQQEKERWELQIAYAEAGALDWSKAQIDAAKATVKGLEREIDEADNFLNLIGSEGVGGALLTKLGFDDDQIDAIMQATNIIIEQISAIAQAEVDAAQAAVDAAQERVEAARAAYDAEVEARNNGYANSVATAAKELEQEKRKEREKQKILEQAQRRKEAIDSVTQTSSLITASALLWQSFAGTGPAAPFLAASAIAAMWASFAVAKIKARQVATASDEYGEGGLEFLEGGSHASGNDIDLGTKNKRGRRMRAEGGEALAIINKRRTRQYKAILPDIIDSLNKGLFEDKYLNAFPSSDSLNTINIMQESNVDLSKLEDDVSSIRKQNETRYFTTPDGTLIMQRKNVKRIIKK